MPWLSQGAASLLSPSLSLFSGREEYGFVCKTPHSLSLQALSLAALPFTHMLLSGFSHVPFSTTDLMLFLEHPYSWPPWSLCTGCVSLSVIAVSPLCVSVTFTIALKKGREEERREWGGKEGAYFGSQFEDSNMAREACWWEHTRQLSL